MAQAQGGSPGFQGASPSAGPAGASAGPVPALPSPLLVPGLAAGRARGDSGDARRPGSPWPRGNVWHLPSLPAAARGAEPINPPGTGPESAAGGGGDESGAVEGTRRRRDADTPGGSVSKPGPHPGEDKAPEQEFDCRLVSHQGIVMPAPSGMCAAHGKFPA